MYLRSPHNLVEVMLTKEELLGKKDMLRNFFAAQNEAYDWLHSTPMEEVAKVVAPIFFGDSNMDALVPALKRNLVECLPSPRWTSRPSTTL